MQLYSAKESAKIDRLAISIDKVPAFELMQRAAESAFNLLNGEWPEEKKITVFCGKGNNAGDGYLLASIAKERGFEVVVITPKNQKNLTTLCKRARSVAKDNKIKICSFKNINNLNINNSVFVDALLGTGLKNQLRKEYMELVQYINTKGQKIMALDIPTGICSDTGKELGDSIKADITVSFIAPKKGCFTSSGRASSGLLIQKDLGIKRSTRNLVKSNCATLDTHKLLNKISNRNPNSHKGSYGHVMIIGGDSGYGGAGLLASKAAAFSGSGLVTLATRKEHISSSLISCPEVMVKGVESGQDLDELISSPDTMVVGPGLGKSAWSQQLLQRVFLEAKRRKFNLVLDADGLNLVSSLNLRLPSKNAVITPHPGEASRLLGKSISFIEEDRFRAAKLLQNKYQSVVVLKGPGTLICYEQAGKQKTMVCEYGNPGMAKGGSGDVLAGIIGSLLAQGLNTRDSSLLGVDLHSISADLSSLEKGEAGMMPSDIIENVPILLKQL